LSDSPALAGTVPGVNNEMIEGPALATPRFYRIAELRLILSLGRSQANEVVNRPDFPRPVRLTPNGDRRWRIAEVEAWMAALPAAEPAPRAEDGRESAPADDLVLVPARPVRRRRAA
jgi:predicted DNA-binding transcriptional regulator AlpA